MHGFSFRIFEYEIEVQDVISPRCLNQSLITSILWMRKQVKNMKKSNGTRIWCLGSSNFSKIQGPSFPFAKNNAFIREIGRDRSMSGRLAIDGRDHASVDRNGAIKSHLSDHRWRIRMCLCYTLRKDASLDGLSDLHRTVTIRRGFHRLRVISVVRTL